MSWEIIMGLETAVLSEQALRDFTLRLTPPAPQGTLHWHSRYLAAKARAERALERHLTDGQRGTLKKEGYFVVPVSPTRRYRIETHCASNNIREERRIDGRWRTVGRWCLGVSDDVPIADLYLTQLLFLRYNERRFREVAILTPCMCIYPEPDDL